MWARFDLYKIELSFLSPVSIHDPISLQTYHIPDPLFRQVVLDANNNLPRASIFFYTFAWLVPDFPLIFPV